MATSPSVVVTWPAGRTVDTGFAQCLSQLLVHDAQSGDRKVLDVISLISSPRISAARNTLTDAALRRDGCEWVLMIDADMAFPPDALDRLLEAADPETAPIVSGLYFGGKPEGIAVAHAYVHGESSASFHPVEGVTNRGEFSGLGRVNMVGAGFLLCHRDALTVVGDTFRETGHAWFAEAIRDGHEVGEDVVFCMRAESLGIPIHCLFDLQLGHIKTGVVDIRTHQQYLLLQDEGRTEAEVNSDWASRFHFAGGTPMPEGPAERIIEKVPNEHESLLTLPGLGNGNGHRAGR